MDINSKIFKAYDIRGIYPQEINETVIADVTKAIYTFFSLKLNKENLSIVIGRDMRLSSPSLFNEMKKTLLELGAEIVDIGLASTPTVYFTVLFNKYDCGIQLSASHNPKDYNGLKFFYRVGNKLVKISKNTGMEEVKNIALTKKFIKSEKKGQIIRFSDALSQEINFAFSIVNPKHLGKTKVVADAANSMGALVLEKLFDKLPAKLIKMNFNLDGTFPAHQPDPLQFKNLKDLQKKVVVEKADLGIAPDGDADRVFFIDEKGQIIPSTLITALVAREILRKNKGERILFDIRYTRNARKIILDYNGIPTISAVGHALITQQLNKENVAFAGESSGHFYFRETGGAESSIRVILYVLEVLGRERKPLSEIISGLQSSYESGEFNFVLPENIKSETILKKIASENNHAKISWLDGLSVDYPDWRFNIRISNTEGLLRLNVEGQTKQMVTKQLEILREKILDYGAVEKK